ncbi:hypothetical protein EC100869_4521, partial [Escherichia coli 10.0869]
VTPRHSCSTTVASARV